MAKSVDSGELRDSVDLRLVVFEKNGDFDNSRGMSLKANVHLKQLSGCSLPRATHGQGPTRGCYVF
jgi:hypothetical protein